MIEIFARSGASSEPATRNTGNSVMLKQPSDVYLGTSAPGIAYYEKAGSDLRVTLLDNQVVVIGNFFSIGENGEFSRLLQSAGGAAEVTGLIAPEPFVPREDAPAVATLVADSAEAPAGQPLAAPAPVAEAPQPAAETQPEAAAASGEGEVAMFGGIGLDLLAFGGANALMLWAGLQNDDDNTPAEPVAGAADAAMEPDLAALLMSLDDPAAAPAEAPFAEPAAAPAADSPPADILAFAAPTSAFEDLPPLTEFF